MGTTLQARRVMRARRIIHRAYRIGGKTAHPHPIRYELIGDSVAVVVLADQHRPARHVAVSLWVARESKSGRARKLRGDSRDNLDSYRDVVAHLELLQKKYGAP